MNPRDFDIDAMCTDAAGCWSVVDASSIVMWIPALAPTLNGREGLMAMSGFKRQSQKETWNRLVAAALSNRKPSDEPCELEDLITRRMPLRECVIVYRRRGCYSQPPDWDNLFSSFKFIGDALTKAGIVRDDNVEIIRRLIPDPERVPERDLQGTALTITDDIRAA